MRKFALSYTLLFAGLILFLGVKAEVFFDMIDSMTWPMLIGGGAFRLGFGVVLIGAAATARYPTALKIIGITAILSVLFIPVMGPEVNGEMFEVLYGRDVWALRGGCTFGLAYLAFVIYALGPRQDDADEVRQLNATPTTGEIK